MKFSVDEMNVISIYDTTDRVNLIARLKEILPRIDDEEMAEITSSAISKLERTTDSEFSATEFKSVLTPEELEGYSNEQTR